MIKQIRHLTSRLVPDELRWKLATKTFPDVVNFTGKIFQGMDYIWDKNAEFNHVYQKVKSRMLLDKKRAFVLYKFCRNCRELDGVFAELGVYRGGSARIMYEASNKQKDIYCFDTFEGMPGVNEAKDNFWQEGDLNANHWDVRTFLHEKNFKIFKGLFPESARNVPDGMGYSLVHIDVDIYKSMMDGCEYFYDKMAKGGIILFDDYSFMSCAGAKEAIDEFFEDKSEVPIPLFTGQCFVCKQ